MVLVWFPVKEHVLHITGIIEKQQNLYENSIRATLKKVYPEMAYSLEKQKFCQGELIPMESSNFI